MKENQALHSQSLASESSLPWWQDRLLISVLVACTLLGLLYNGAILVGFGPDELRHMAYIKLLAHQHVLPYLLADGSEYRGAHTLHPPLYYLAMMPFYVLAQMLPASLSWHFVRLGSLCLCLWSLLLIYQIALRLGHNQRLFATLVAAQIGFLPMFGMTAATVNNDSAALFAVTAFLWLLTLRYNAESGTRPIVLLGLCLGLGGWCKASVLLCDVAALVFALLLGQSATAWRRRRIWQHLLAISAIALLVMIPWAIHCYLVFGTPMPVPPRMQSPTGGQWIMIFHPDFPRYVLMACWGILSTLWTQIDWIPVTLRDPVFIILAAYMVVATVGHARRNRAVPRGEVERLGLYAAYAAFAANWLIVLQGALFLTWGWAQGGRYLLPSLTGFSLFAARGWQSLLPQKLKGVLFLWCAALLALNAICLFWLWAYLNPTFGKG